MLTVTLLSVLIEDIETWLNQEHDKLKFKKKIKYSTHVEQTCQLDDKITNGDDNK